MSTQVKFRVFSPKYVLTTTDSEELVKKLRKEAGNDLPSTEEEKLCGWIKEKGQSVGARTAVEAGKVTYLVVVEAIPPLSAFEKPSL